MQGQSLQPLLMAGGAFAAREAWRSRPAFSVAIDPGLEEDANDHWPNESYGMLDGHWMLVHNFRKPAGIAEFELYDQRTDPLHQPDVAGDNPEIVERLAAKIVAWRKQTNNDRVVADEDLEGLDADELKRLRALGYVN